jgi:exopolysaccharide production protein ExoZ
VTRGAAAASAPARAHTAPRLPQIVSIQYLRALAALAVVAFHAFEAEAHRLAVGAAGVDVFFVISGFIMWTLTEHAESGPGAFLWRRIVRVAPPYWAATLLAALVWTVRPHFLWMPPFGAADLARSLAFIPYADAWGRTFPVLTQGWTLDYEMFFYAVFALVLLAPRRWQLAALTLAFAVLIAVGLAASPTRPVVAAFTSPLLAEFLAGAWLGRIWLTGRLRSRAGGVLLLAGGLAAFAAANVLGIPKGLLRLLVWGLPALALVTGALLLEGAGLVRCWKVPKALGDGSYSIYLFHVFVVAATYRVLGDAPTAVRVGAALLASAVAGWLLFVGLERPLTSALRNLPRLVRSPPARLQRAGLP